MRRLRRTAVLAASLAGWMILALPAFAQAGGSSGDNIRLLTMIATIGIAIAAFLLVIILFGKAGKAASTVRSRLGSYAREDDTADGVLAKFPVLRRFARRAERVAERRGVLGNIETALEQANMPIRPGEAILGAIGLAIVVGLIAGALSRSVLWTLLAGVGVLLVAAFMVNYIAGKERKRFEAQLPDTLNLVSTSLRAGYSLLQAVEAVAQEAPEPTAREFGRAISEIRLGRTVTDALKDIADRMESTDFDWTVLAISIQREVGGNLAEVLQTTSETMLQRNRLRREMHALTAEGRISAIVLSALPFFLFGVIMVINPDYLQPLMNTAQGIIAMVVAFVLILIGIFWLTRIVKIDV